MLLVAVDGVVGGVEVECEMLGWRRVGGDELIDEDAGQTVGSRAVDAVFQPTQSRG